MVNITGNLISLSGSVTWSGSTNPYYYIWSSSQIDSVCQALKNLLTTNVPAFSVVKSASNDYVLMHSQLESGYAIRISGYGSASTTSESYVVISEGTWDGSSYTSKIYYYLKPYISNASSTSNNYQSGTMTWSWNYGYQLLVDDDGRYFAITFSSSGVPTNMFSYSSYGFAFRYAYSSYTNSYQSTAISSTGRFIFGVFPISGTGYLTFFESTANTESAPFSAYLISGYASSRWNIRVSPTRGGTNNPNYIFCGWTIYNRKYVIASTMFPNLRETDYGEIKMVKLGVHEYGLPYIIDGLYLDNFFACERNSNLVNNQIIEIDGYKYLYCDSGYLFKLGVVPVVLDTPTISLSSDTLTITTVTNADGYKVYKDGVLLVTSSNTTVDLSNYISVAGTYSITVRATSNDVRYLDSDPSTAVSYTVTPQPLTAPTISLSGSTLTITAVTGAEGYKVYEGNNLIATVQTTTVDLSSYISAAGTYTITATAYATGVSDSSASNSVSYTVMSGYTVTFGTDSAYTSLTVTYNGTSHTFGDAPFTVPVNSSLYFSVTVYASGHPIRYYVDETLVESGEGAGGDYTLDYTYTVTSNITITADGSDSSWGLNVRIATA